MNLSDCSLDLFTDQKIWPNMSIKYPFKSPGRTCLMKKKFTQQLKSVRLQDCLSSGQSLRSNWQFAVMVILQEIYKFSDYISFLVFFIFECHCFVKMTSHLTTLGISSTFSCKSGIMFLTLQFIFIIGKFSLCNFSTKQSRKASLSI